MPKVMLCEDYVPERFKPPMAISPKYDGIRATWHPGDTYLVSRNEKPIYGMEHIIAEFVRQEVGPQDMELVIPGMEFNKLSGLVRNHQRTPEAMAMIIDAPIPKYVLTQRLKLRAAYSECTTPIPHHVVNNADSVISAYEKALYDGCEGVVLKTLNHVYSGRRSYDWMRIVPVTSIDVMVTGLYEGEGKLKNKCGGFYFVFNEQVCKCGTMLGITEDERGYMWFAQNEYLGRTAIVEFKELQPSGKPRQPRLKGFRDDK